MSEARTTPALAAIPEAVLEAAQARFDTIQQRIARAAERAGRSPGDIRLVGVAKRQPDERLLAAIAAGLRTVGQSYIQEARAVRPRIDAVLAGAPFLGDARIEWRMVGRLQSNKAGQAARLFDAIESVDRPKLVSVLDKRARDEGKILECLIQVSLCGEPQKGGCELDDLLPIARQIHEAEGLRLGGLMTVPAAGPDPEAARPVFRALREARRRLAELDPAQADCALSMGMSGDFEVAIEEGATLVRVGTALFGERVEPSP